ncbi:nucleotidyltransferase domain-containing protein [Methylomonas sp. MgM2]
MNDDNSLLLIRYLAFDLAPYSYREDEWELLIRQARAAGVLARLTFYWKKFELFCPPPFVSRHLDSAEKYWLSQKRIINWELHNLKPIFHQLQLPLILLKGTAYSAANLNAGFGRVFNDIDILVPKQRLSEVTRALRWSGWLPERLNSYDQRYYECWMHELPPLRHIERGTTLDVHHNVLPLTCDLAPKPELLLNAIVEVPNQGLWTLAPEDMVLHSACHLFWGGEFENGLRDLSDIDLLLREFSNNDRDFWQKLLVRAEALNLRKPLFNALFCSHKILNTPLSIEAIKIVEGFNKRFEDKIVAQLFLKALKPRHPSCEDYLTGFARWMLYVRSHWLKMPLYLLIPHLSRKAWLRIVKKED